MRPILRIPLVLLATCMASPALAQQDAEYELISYDGRPPSTEFVSSPRPAYAVLLLRADGTWLWSETHTGGRGLQALADSGTYRIVRGRMAILSLTGERDPMEITPPGPDGLLRIGEARRAEAYTGAWCRSRGRTGHTRPSGRTAGRFRC